MSKACETITIDTEQNWHNFKLLTTRGSIIPKDESWTVGSYLFKRHISAEKLSLGVGSEDYDESGFSGVEQDEQQHNSFPPKKARVSDGPPEPINNDTLGL